MKKLLINIFATTGISLGMFSLMALFFKAEWLYLATVFQIWGANVAVHLGLLLIQTWEPRYTVLESIFDFIWVFGVLIAFGVFFGWFANMLMRVLVIMALVIYTVAFFLDSLHKKLETEELNRLIEKRKQERILLQGGGLYTEQTKR